MGEGITSVFSAVLGQVPTLFSYFNPSRSPYYAMTVAGIAALCVTMHLGVNEWASVFVPMGILLVVLVSATMQSPKFLFSVDEYNDQLKFARSLAVTTAVVCVVFVAHRDQFSPIAPVDLVQWMLTIVYALCLGQIVLFLAYAFIFAGYDQSVTRLETTSSEDMPHSPQHMRTERNYVQIALVMCALLAGMTYIADHSSGGATYKTCIAKDGLTKCEFEWQAGLLFVLIWGACAIQVLLFVRDNFSLQPPKGVVRPLQSGGGNVVTLRQVETQAGPTKRVASGGGAESGSS